MPRSTGRDPRCSESMTSGRRHRRGTADETVCGARPQADRCLSASPSEQPSGSSIRSWQQPFRPLGDVFIKAIGIVVIPIILTTIVVGIAQTGDLREIARLGVTAIVYFELISTLAGRRDGG